MNITLTRARTTAVVAIAAAVALAVALTVTVVSFTTAPAPDITYAACNSVTLPAYTDKQFCYDTSTGVLRAITPSDPVASAAAAR